MRAVKWSAEDETTLRRLLDRKRRFKEMHQDKLKAAMARIPGNVLQQGAMPITAYLLDNKDVVDQLVLALASFSSRYDAVPKAEVPDADPAGS